MPLTPEQRAVVEFDPGVRLHRVNSVAGSGKTHTLVELVRALVIRDRCEPDQIVVCTFTRSAASELRQRLSDLGVVIKYLGTFHSISSSVLQGEISPLVSLNEMCLNLLRYIREPPEDDAFSRLRYVVVDEAQDIDAEQYQIVEAFSERPGIGVFAFGDISQNIFGWRGSESRFFAEFLPGHTTYRLSTNFRSTPEIVALANHSISGEATMRACSESGARPYFSMRPTANDERRVIAMQIERDIAEGRGTIAVLSRTRRALAYIREELMRRGILVTERVRENRVSVMTLHSAKGLEWDVVYMASCNDSTFPNAKDPDSLLEERRLWHVGVTRARRRLVVTCTESPSRFVYEGGDVHELYDVVGDLLESTFKLAPDCRKRKSDIRDIARNFGAAEFQMVRERGMFPVNVRARELYDAMEIPEEIVDHELEADYHLFLRIVAQYAMGCRDFDACRVCARTVYPGHGDADRERKERLFSRVLRCSKESPFQLEATESIERAYLRVLDGSADERDLWIAAACVRCIEYRDSTMFFKTDFLPRDTTHVRQFRESVSGFVAVRWNQRVAYGSLTGVLETFASDHVIRIASISDGVSASDVLESVIIAAVLRAEQCDPRGIVFIEPFNGIAHEISLDGLDLEQLLEYCKTR